MSINIEDKEKPTVNCPLTLDFLADQWVELVMAHIQAKRNLKKYNDYKFPVEVAPYEK